MGLFDALGLTSKPSADLDRTQNLAALGGYQDTAATNLGAYGTQARGDINAALSQGVGAVNTGLQGGLDAYGQAVNAYNPLASLGSQYGGAVNAYYDALGLGGQAGKDRALANFQAGPGYQWMQDEASRGIINNASRFGAGGGNTLTALQDRASQLANQTWQSNYLQPLSAFPSLASSTIGAAAGGQAQGYTGMAGANIGAGNTLAGLYGTAGSDLANIGGNVLQGQLGTAGNVLTGTQAANNAVASAAAADNANKWSFLNTLGGAATKAAFPKV
jgi:hypothetical protein